MSYVKKYAPIKHFTNSELIQIITANAAKRKHNAQEASWMSFDVKNETKNEKMEKNKIRYLTILVRDMQGVERQLVRTTAATTTKSRCKLGQSEDNRIPSSANFSTRICINHLVGDTVLGKEFTEQALNKLIAEMADNIVNTKFPNIPDSEFESKCNMQGEILKAEYQQWIVERHISVEFERLLMDADERDRIAYAKTQKHDIEGNVQFFRDPLPNDKDDRKLANSSGVIPLDEPMVYYRIRIDGKDGKPWCKIYDKTDPKNAKSLVPATCRDPESGTTELLTYKTLETWLRFNSVVVGLVKYSLCITPKGPRLHAAFSEMHVRRAAESKAGSQMDGKSTDMMGEFGGDFDDADSDSDDAQKVQVKLQDFAIDN